MVSHEFADFGVSGRLGGPSILGDLEVTKSQTYIQLSVSLST